MQAHSGIPHGFCQCNCGERTRVVSGKPNRFIHGHHLRQNVPQWREEECGHDTPCWVWQWYIGNSGYGRMSVLPRGRIIYAHRYVYERLAAPIPEGLELDHLCRVRACVNPAHLEPVTKAENRRRSSASKLTREQADAIRRAENMSTEALAQQYAVSAPTIRDILSGRTWT